MFYITECKRRCLNVKKCSTIVVTTMIILATIVISSAPTIDDTDTMRINEIMYNPQGLDSGREWIEIYNTADSTVNITDWRLCEGGINHTITLIYGSMEIPSHDFAVIADNYVKFLDDYPQYNGTLIDSSFKLKNTGEYLAIKNESLVIIDEIAYTPQGGADDTGMTIEYKTNNQWKVSITYGGTPGGPNSVWEPPFKPTDPNPVNNSENISINPNLSVKVVDLDNDTMDVYFYNAQNNSLIEVADNVTNGSRAEVNWTNLEYNTTYYWYTVANDSFFENKSDTWMFTTKIFTEENNPPLIPYNPNPANGSTNISIFIDLNWMGGDPDGDPVTYDIFFGTNSTPPKVISNQTNTTYKPGILDFNTTYFWKVIAWDNHSASSKNSTWLFTTKVNNPPYKPGDPIPGNNSKNVDINIDLEWTAYDPDGDPLTFDVYFGDTNQPPQLAWNISDSFDPGTMNYGETYYWKVVAWDNYGESTPGPIWIFTTINPKPPAVEITCPRKGGFYLNNIRLFPLLINTIVYGPIDITVNATSDLGIERVDFFINGRLKETVNQEPFSYKWSPLLCMPYKIKVVAYDIANQNTSATVSVLKWRVHPLLILIGILLLLRYVRTPLKWSLLRGTVFNLHRSGNKYHTRALRLHYTEFDLFSRTSSITNLKKISFNQSPFIRTYDIGPFGLTKYIIGLVPGSIKG